MSYSVRIEKDLCVSAGKCVGDAPNAFGYDADELAEVLPGVSELSDESLVRLARQCPGRAIILTDERGGAIEF
jgi:ferredoxin